GQQWQFKPFKRWHSNPVEIFAKIPAFHVHYDDLNSYFANSPFLGGLKRRQMGCDEVASLTVKAAYG
ncbi:hypothetical protein OESDEN_18177, partial [Oesophagostomum dentatum]